MIAAILVSLGVKASSYVVVGLAGVAAGYAFRGKIHAGVAEAGKIQAGAQNITKKL